jgi:lysophospholipase L1-like esterase
MPRLRSIAALTTSLVVLTLVGVLVSSRFALGLALNTLVALVSVAALGSLLFVVLEVSTTLLRVSRHTKNRLRLLLGTTLLLLAMTELVLRIGVRRYTTYPEQNGFLYGSLYERRYTSWYYTMASLPEVEYSKSEFTYHRQVNSLGLCEREVPLDKGAGEFRVLALGDSFTEGVGTSYDTTWVKVVERHLAAAMPDRTVTTINAGISGSDPFYEYVLLRDRLLPYRPDLVIVAINPSDMYDVLIRGGMQRFRPGGSTQYARKAPRWELIYATSYIVRVVVHEVLGYNWLLIRESEMESPTRVAAEEIESVLADIQTLAEEHDFDLLVVVHPASYHEVLYGEYGNGFGLVASRLKESGSPESLDLLDYYGRTGIINKENVGEFFWSLDGHHNTDGYLAMGDAIAETVLGSMTLPRSQ